VITLDLSIKQDTGPVENGKMKGNTTTVKEAKQALQMKWRAGLISEEVYNLHFDRYSLIEDASAELEKAMSKDLAGAVGDLKAKAGNADFKQVASKGTEDGAPDDEKVSFTTTSVPAKKMYPTQAEIGFGNSLDDIINDKYGAIDSAFKNPVKMPSPDGKIPVLCAEIGGKIAILDGHHRWSLCFMINPEADMMCDIMKAPAGMDAGEALKAMQLAIAAKAGKVVTKPFEGKDLMATSPGEVKKYVEQGIGGKEIKKFMTYKPELFGKTSTKEPSDTQQDTVSEKTDKDKNSKAFARRQALSRATVANYIANNHKLILAMKGPYPRNIMPQAGKSGVNQSDVNAALQAGDINFKEPFKVSESSTKALDNMLKESIKKGSD